MLCDFYPLPTKVSFNNMGLPISIFEIVQIIWVLSFTIDLFREVSIAEILKLDNNNKTFQSINSENNA